jgi:hypothetical protein
MIPVALHRMFNPQQVQEIVEWYKKEHATLDGSCDLSQEISYIFTPKGEDLHIEIRNNITGHSITFCDS